MLKRAAFTSLLLAAALSSRAQQAPADPDAAEPQVASRAVMTGEQVIRILDESVAWYRLLGVQQQSATQPSDLLLLYANQQTADRVVALAFEIARANAELLSSQAEMDERDSPDASLRVLRESRQDLDARRQKIRTEMAAAQRQIESAAAPERAELQAKVAELQSELDLVSARRNLLETMAQFAHDSDANGSGVSALKEHIDAIAATIPAAAAGTAPAAGRAQVQAGAAIAGSPMLSSAEQGNGSRPGIWELGSEVMRLRGKLESIDDVDRRTEDLQKTFAEIRAAPEQQVKALSARGDAIANRSGQTDTAALKTARDEYDTLAWLFKQTSAIFVPLTNAGVLLDQYRGNLANWRDSARTQFVSALKALAARLALVGALLGAVFGGAELWKRGVFRYVHDARRRNQLLIVRRIVMWVVALVIVGIAFATEASSFATFAGLLTAGVAVAMQSVLVSIVGYFFLIGKYGLRVGDRVQIGGVTGEVIDLGLVRLHLIEVGPTHGPTGRVVAFANSVVFQTAGGIFKQIPGVNLAWRDITLAVPQGADYAAVKQRLHDASVRVLKDYRDELERQTRELRRASSSRVTEEAQPYVQLRFSAGAVDAIVRYPVPLEHAAEVEERMSRELIGVIRASAAEPAALAAQPRPS